MKILKRIIVIVVCVCIFGGIIALCSVSCFGKGKGNVGENIPVDVDLDKNYEAEITIATGAGYVSDMKSVIKEFNKIYPNITVETKVQPDLSESILRWHNADLSKPGSCPDIILNEGQMWVALKEGEILKDLTPYIEASFENGSLDKNDIIKEIWRCGKENYSENGKHYYIPTNYDQFVAVINTDILNGLNIPLPRKDWTWTECIDILRRVKEGYNDLINESSGFSFAQTGIPATMSLQSDAMMHAIYKSFGVEFFDENNNIKFDSDATKKAMEFMKSLVDNGYCDPMKELPIASGQVAIQFQSRPAITDLTGSVAQAEFPNTGYFTLDSIDVWPMPRMDIETSTKQTYVGGGSLGYVMYSRTDEPNAAWAFMRFLISKTSYDVYGKGKLVPILRSMQEDKNALWRTLPREGMNQDAFVQDPELFTPASFHMNLPSKIRSEVYNVIIQMNLDAIRGTKSIAKSISDAVSKVNYQFERV